MFLVLSENVSSLLFLIQAFLILGKGPRTRSARAKLLIWKATLWLVGKFRRFSMTFDQVTIRVRQIDNKSIMENNYPFREAKKGLMKLLQF